MIVTDMPVDRLIPYARNPRNNTGSSGAALVAAGGMTPIANPQIMRKVSLVSNPNWPCRPQKAPFGLNYPGFGENFGMLREIAKPRNIVCRRFWSAVRIALQVIST